MSEHERGSARLRAAEAAPTLELIVPGTQEISPQYVLGDPQALQIGGDRRTRLHRRAVDIDAEQHPEEYRYRPIAESYTWGSRAGDPPTRGLWLLLLPFLLVNLASWMRPPDQFKGQEHRRSSASRSYGVLMRLLAATLTVHLVAASAAISMDLTAWQCAATSTSCVQENTWLLFLSPANGSWWARPGPTLALGALLPLAVIALLTRLSQRTWRRTEALRPAPTMFDIDGPAVGPALSRPGFWYGRRQVSRLRSAHTTLALSTVSLLLLAALSGTDRKHGDAVQTGFDLALGGSVLIATGFAVWEVARAGRSEHRVDTRSSRVAAYSPMVSLALLVMTMADAFIGRPGWQAAGQLPGLETLFLGLLVAETALIVGLVACCMRPAALTYRVALRGFGGPAVALLASWLATVFSAVPIVMVANLLEGKRTRGSGTIAGPPLSVQIAAYGPVFIVGIAVLLAMAVAVLHTRKVRHLRFVVERDYPGEPPDPLRSDEIARAHSSAALTENLPVLLTGACGAAVLHFAQIATGTLDSYAYEQALDVLVVLGTWLGPILAVLLLFAGWTAYGWPAARRSVGLLWDLSTFWPRASHPFGPPCLAERAVPDLQWRMVAWMRSTGGRLLLSGHGQGSVLAAAAALQLEPQYRRRICLLTYGSPLTRIYGRYFPAYFGSRQLHMVELELMAWRNLWRRTDPIGGSLEVNSDFMQVDSSPLRDPLAFGRTMEHPLYAPILGHDEYQADPVFARERSMLLAKLTPRTPPSTRTSSPKA